MPHPLEYIVSDALINCSEGGAPAKFTGTHNTTVKIHSCLVTTADDKEPITNIPSFKVCLKTQKPCMPAPSTWRETFPVNVKGAKALIGSSCINCSAGGEISFLTSGQVPLPAEVEEEVSSMQESADEFLEQKQAEEGAVGETGFAEGLIPVWGSGRDMINDIQTGDVGGTLLNAGFLVWDVGSIVAGVFSFGAGTAAMQGVKAGVKGGIKAGAKSAAKSLSKETLKALGKGAFKALSKDSLKKSIDDLAKALGRSCVFACFPAGTLVATPSGRKPIESLQAGDKVYAWDEENQRASIKPVVHTFQLLSDLLVEITLGSGEIIRTTPTHPFCVPEQEEPEKNATEDRLSSTGTELVAEAGKPGSLAYRWKDAGELEPGDLLILKNGKSTEITQVRLLQDEITVYNFEVEDAGTYFVGADEVLVHNGSCAKKLRELYLGRTPGKRSRTGREVIDRMTKAGKVKTIRGKRKFQASDGKWYDMKYADMSHRTDAVKWWNSTGRKYGAKSPEVRKWMLDSKNYYLDHRSINRSQGAKLTDRYLPPI